MHLYAVGIETMGVWCKEKEGKSYIRNRKKHVLKWVKIDRKPKQAIRYKKEAKPLEDNYQPKIYNY